MATPTGTTCTECGEPTYAVSVDGRRSLYHQVRPADDHAARGPLPSGRPRDVLGEDAVAQNDYERMVWKDAPY